MNKPLCGPSTRPCPSSLILVEGGVQARRLSFPRSQDPRIRGLQRDAEGLEGEPLTRSHCLKRAPLASVFFVKIEAR
jgi:hypothetical protein